MSTCQPCYAHDALHGDRFRRRSAPCRQHGSTRLVRRLLTCRKSSPQDIANVAQAADAIIQHGPHVWSAVAPPDGTPGVVPPPPQSTHQEIQCTLSGLDSVMCVIEDVPDAEDETSAASSMALPVVAAQAHVSPLATVMETALLVSPFFFWGTSMVAMKSVIPHTTPLVLGALRLLPAGLLLVGWAASTGRAQPSSLKAWAWVLAFALVDAACFQGFLAEGLTKTSAGLGSVIIDSQPLTVAVLASLLFGERLSGLGVVGLALGVAGLALLEVPGDSLAEAAQALVSGAWRPELPGAAAGGLGGLGAELSSSGEFWMLLAAQSMALGTVMVRYVTKHVDPIMATGYHMIIGGAILAAAAAATGDAAVAAAGDGAAAAAAATAAATASSSPLASLAAQLSHLTLEDAVSMSYVSLAGGALSYGIFFWYASHGSLTALSSLTFLTPVFASAAGYLALGEVLSPMQLLGGAVTLSAVWCINHKPAPGGGGGGGSGGPSPTPLAKGNEAAAAAEAHM
ncbi:hypothetical protein PLESTB_000910500 [Pleodorina starrii]|uniref:EamA domain-containing protein n=1 Tax=Pleodorina starrii TaxID=330485 RepID=A0A9W6BN72_9CHLO|nr:hypothetical protein PLESTM_001522000 [Pleodorina starrii]GLC54830.1 hypothetical protein PLESTB_000910500 [Pleodorina starrii]GLC73723.1 hypothetical protein PLESTF_001412200 [Pleodorina starrii]